jgi:hypothetical protein
MQGKMSQPPSDVAANAKQRVLSSSRIKLPAKGLVRDAELRAVRRSPQSIPS